MPPSQIQGPVDSAVDDATWNEYIAERNSRRITTTPIPTFVAVKGVNQDLSQKVETLMAGVVGKPLNYDELDAAIMRLKGTGRYSTSQLWIRRAKR